MASKSSRSKKKNAPVDLPEPIVEAPPPPVVAAATQRIAEKKARKAAELNVAPAASPAPPSLPEEAAPTFDQERAQLTAQWEQEREHLLAQWQAERETLTARLGQELASLEERLHAEKEVLQEQLLKAQGQASEAELELELTQQQAADLQVQLETARHEIEAETSQIMHLQDEMGEAMRRVESKEASHEALVSQIQELEQSLQEAHRRDQEQLEQIEELGLLKEDLEETVVERRRELKSLRISENEARTYAEACKTFRVEAEERVKNAVGEQERMRRMHEQELHQLEERLERSRVRQEELLKQVEAAAQSSNEEAVKEAERRHLAAEKRLIEVYAELESLKKDGGDRERLERRCLLLENDLKAANQELMSLEHAQSQWEAEKQQLKQVSAANAKDGGVAFLAATPGQTPAGGGADEAEIRQWKLRSDDLREALRKQRTENERLTERIDVLIKAKELEEKQRKEVESRLRTALRIQARQQQGY